MNKNRKQENILTVKCGISGENIPPSEAICSNIASNNTKHYSKKYHNYFNDIEISDSFENILLTCVVIDGILKIKNEVLQNYKTNEINALYTIYFKKDITLYCNGSNAQVKKYLNQLTTYKKAIKTITFLGINNKEIVLQDININPVYARQKYLYNNKLGYNPDSKKTIKKTW